MFPGSHGSGSSHHRSTWRPAGIVRTTKVQRRVSRRAVFRIDLLGPGSSGISKQAAVVARATSDVGGTVRWYSCGLDAARDRVEIRMWDGSAHSTLAQADLGIDVDAGTADYRVSLLVRGDSLSCAAEAPLALPVVVGATSTTFVAGAPGVRTYRIAASFSGLMVAR